MLITNHDSMGSSVGIKLTLELSSVKLVNYSCLYNVLRYCCERNKTILFLPYDLHWRRKQDPNSVMSIKLKDSLPLENIEELKAWIEVFDAQARSKGV